MTDKIITAGISHNASTHVDGSVTKDFGFHVSKVSKDGTLGMWAINPSSPKHATVIASECTFRLFQLTKPVDSPVEAIVALLAMKDTFNKAETAFLNDLHARRTQVVLPKASKAGDNAKVVVDAPKKKLSADAAKAKLNEQLSKIKNISAVKAPKVNKEPVPA